MGGIVIIEDEEGLNNLICGHLKAEGHTVHQAFDGPAGLGLVETHNPQLVILDWMLPGLDGLAVCRRIRQNHLVPIIMLTARGEEIDRVLGLEVGADDYVVKPFGIRELLARVRSILRRVALDTSAIASHDPVLDTKNADERVAPPPAPPPVIRGPLIIDPANRSVTLHGEPVEMTRREFDLLILLATHPGRVFSREYLLETLWGYDYPGYDRTVDSHIVRLRRKLNPLGEKIETVRGIGYRFIS